MYEPVVPNFFIVGTGKAGTTSLYHYLRQHPQIYMSPVKEPCYFASEIRPENLERLHFRHIQRQTRNLAELLGDGRPVSPAGWLVSEWEDYLRLFAKVQAETAIGEASAAYLWSENAADNIAARVPTAKIIMILRDPAERAFSQYAHLLSMGLTRASFRDHIETCLHYRDRKLGPYYPLLEVGLYHRQVQRYLQRFPENNIRIYWYEDVWRQPATFLADLFQFLNVDATFSPDTTHKSLQRRTPRFATVGYVARQFEITHQLSEWAPPLLRSQIRKMLFHTARPVMDSNDRQYLIDYYREDILNLAALLNRELSAWLS